MSTERNIIIILCRGVYHAAGFPLATILQRDGTGDATTLLCHVHTPPDQLRVMTQLADIIIVGTGIYIATLLCLAGYHELCEL